VQQSTSGSKPLEVLMELESIEQENSKLKVAHPRTANSFLPLYI
jgi:hypothetical protein